MTPAMIFDRTRFLRAALFCSVSALGCSDGGSAAKHESPARLVKPSDESLVNQVKLTADAERRLGVTLATVRREPVERVRTLGGVAEIPIGKALSVSAPLAGTLTASPELSQLAPGTPVSAGSVLVVLQLTEAERAQVANAAATLAAALTTAQGDIERAEAELEVGRIALRRAEELVRDRAGSQRNVDEARAISKVAAAALAAATARYEALEKLRLESKPGGPATIPITSPQGGILRTISAAPGETVSAGEVLFEVVDLSTLWIRVPVNAGLAPQIEPEKAATVELLGERQSNTTPIEPLTAKRAAAAPPAADSMTSTIDVIYEIPNLEGAIRPGQRLLVTLPLRGEAESLIVPYSSVLYDIHGGTWVYAKAGERTYERTRVEVRHMLGNRVLIARGVQEGVEVVVDGAAEIFGTEFGSGK